MAIDSIRMGFRSLPQIDDEYIARLHSLQAKLRGEISTGKTAWNLFHNWNASSVATILGYAPIGCSVDMKSCHCSS